MAFGVRPHLIDENDPRVSKFGHSAPPWLVNYADLMTELVILFIVLYALSAALNRNVQRAREEIQQMLEREKIAGEVRVEREGLRISLSEKGATPFFESGKAEITPRMQEILAHMAPTLRRLVEQAQQVIVEGHTDNVPIRTRQFASNWELSTARATNVVRALVHEFGLPPQPLAAIGYGEYRPVAPNDTPENRARNRRVVFFVKPVPPGKPYPVRTSEEMSRTALDRRL